MPSYCSIITDVNHIPSEADMTLFKPYFKIDDGVSQFDVKIKVPSNCYFLESQDNNPPAGGPCGAPSDLQHSIYLDKEPGCVSSLEKVISVTLHYHEDPNGEKLIVYVIDNADAAKTKGGSRTNKKLQS